MCRNPGSSRSYGIALWLNLRMNPPARKDTKIWAPGGYPQLNHRVLFRKRPSLWRINTPTPIHPPLIPKSRHWKPVNGLFALLLTDRISEIVHESTDFSFRQRNCSFQRGACQRTLSDKALKKLIGRNYETCWSVIWSIVFFAMCKYLSEFSIRAFAMIKSGPTDSMLIDFQAGDRNLVKEKPARGRCLQPDSDIYA